MSADTTSRSALWQRNPAWVQLLGLCPLLAVTCNLTYALGLAVVIFGVTFASSLSASLLRHCLPRSIRLPCFVLIIATLGTIATLLLEAYAYELFASMALFVQIIVTNCMILGHAESNASTRSVGRAARDAIVTSLGFALALLLMGAVREILGSGTLLADAQLLFGSRAATWTVHIGESGVAPLARYAPGAFIVGGLLVALGQVAAGKRV
ncbi:MAG: electron transport complex subunit RsxE [Pseudomonadota bacterium]